MKERIMLHVNGQSYELLVNPGDMLVDVLRRQLGLIGTKKGCGEGDCGVCTVLINGEPVLSCILLAVACQGKEILTIEGLSKNGQLTILQKAFIHRGAVQCGYCTPGMILTAKALLDRNPNPTKEEVKRAISGNLCRCTGYKKIEEAILLASEQGAGEINEEGGE